MTKWLFFLMVCPSTLWAQTVFHKKIDSLTAAYGLAQMPDGGYLVSGLWHNCVQLLRLDAEANALWTKQVCPINLNDDLSIGELQVLADEHSGGFFLMFRKGGFSAAPDNLLQLMRFDMEGNLLWQAQLKPTLRYGPLSLGRALAAAPDGTSWAVHGLGFTPDLPYFNRPLVFKILPDGTVALRRYYRAPDPATANGIVVQNQDEIYLYGSLAASGNHGFLLKINGNGSVQWARQYTNLSLIREGGRFQNGDFLLYGADNTGEMSFARIRLDGQIVWAKKMVGGIRPDLFQAGQDDRVYALVRQIKPNPDSIAPAVLLRLAPNADALDWAYTYETCTNYLVSALQPSPDGGLLFLQNADHAPRARFLKASAEGRLPPGCSAQAFPLPQPLLTDIQVETNDLIFNEESTNIATSQNIFQVQSSEAYLSDQCPAEGPDAYFPLPDSTCARTSLRLVSGGNSSADAWQWSLPGSSLPEAQGFEVKNAIYPKAGLYPLSLTQRYGICSHTFTDTLLVLPPLVDDLFGFSDTLLCPDRPLKVEPLDSTIFDAWLWSDGHQHAARILDTPRSGTYRLQAVRGLCTVADSFQVRVYRCGSVGFYAPNVFSPNDDGQEDVWEVSLQSGAMPLGCTIYDRWGSQVYASEVGEVPRWNGRFRGKTASPGVFVWVLRFRDAEGMERVERGPATLVR